MTLDFTHLLKPLLVMPIIGVALLVTGILVDHLRRRHPEPNRT